MNTETRSIGEAKTIYRCPQCSGTLENNGVQLNCGRCGAAFDRKEGYWQLLAEVQGRDREKFVSEYNVLRKREGRSHTEQSFYESLPYPGRSTRFSRIWRRRARHWNIFIQRVLADMEVRRKRPLQIADLGAGNGWTSNRLAQRGHNVWSVDINSDPMEGLQAHAFYRSDFTSIQAEFNNLPFQERTFDLALFNGSIHYSRNLDVTLKEAFRILRPGGEVVLMDTPFYKDRQSGEQMVEEKKEYKQRVCPEWESEPDVIHYLTREDIKRYCERYNCRADYQTVGLPARERARRVWRSLRGAREESDMPVVVMSQKWPVNRGEKKMFSWMRKSKVLKVGWLMLMRGYMKWVKKFKYNRPTTERINGIEIQVDQNVFNPRQLRSGKFLTEELEKHFSIEATDPVLDLGTGTGIGAIQAAKWSDRVVATDINPQAVACTQKNIERLNLDQSIEVREGDLFEPVGDEQFKWILFNPPYFHGNPENALEQSWYSNKIPKRFAKEVGNYLKPGGAILMVLSDHGEPEEFIWNLHEGGFCIESVEHRDYINEILTLYKITARQV